MAKRVKKLSAKDRPNLSALDDAILDAGQKQFCDGMTELARQLKTFLDRCCIPITGKIDIDERNKVKEVITEFLFSVFDSSDDDGEHRPGVFDYKYISKMPPAFWEEMQIVLARNFYDKATTLIGQAEFNELLPTCFEPQVNPADFFPAPQPREDLGDIIGFAVPRRI
ncbi:MAG: hypothetical protein LLF76_03160 [Planctomycetaceae bacterium]|nr:hypothetical protein [Planctomycetaceae bacterium]